MVQKSEKKEKLRTQIIAAAGIYSTLLAGKTFLYVFGTEYFELLFKTDRFVHLTGVDTSLHARDFYVKAKNGLLTSQQFSFSKRHPFETAKKKLSCLTQLPCLTNNLVCVVKDLSTLTLSYKLGVTNLEFTLGLTENTDSNGNTIDSTFVPRTLRVRDHSIENSRDAEFVDFILVKDGSQCKYDTVLFADPLKSLPDSIHGKISDSLRAHLAKDDCVDTVPQAV